MFDIDLGELIPKKARPYVLGAGLMLLAFFGVRWIVNDSLVPVNVGIQQVLQDHKDFKAERRIAQEDHIAHEESQDKKLADTISVVNNLVHEVNVEEQDPHFKPSVSKSRPNE